MPDFHFLSSVSVVASHYSASASSFPCFLSPPHSGFLSAPFLLSLPRSSPFAPAWFPVHSFPVPVLSFLFVSFRPSLIRFPQLFLRCFPYALALGIFRFPSASFRPLPFRLRLLSLLLLPFCPLDLRLTVGFPSRLRFLSSPSLLPFIHGWFPVRFLPVLHTQLSVRFLSSCPASLPQPFHR